MVDRPAPVISDTMLERRLRPYRRTIAVVVPTVGVTLLAAANFVDIPLLKQLAVFPPLLVAANAVMALPLAAGLAPATTRRGIMGLAGLALFSYGIEGVGVATGWPYGRFAYAAGLDPLLLGLVPLALPVFWLPMLVNGYLLALLFCGGRQGSASRPDPAPTSVPDASPESAPGPPSGSVPTRDQGRPWVASMLPLLLLATACTVLLDLIMDPGAVALGFWSWVIPGRYYGVPAVNFTGWLLSGVVGVCVLAWAFPPRTVRPLLHRDALIFDTLAAFLVFWGAINALGGQWIPVLLALGLGAAVRVAIGRTPPTAVGSSARSRNN